MKGVPLSIAELVGRGLAAGAVGTVALTLAEKAEMALTGREPSTVPGQVGARLSGHDPHADAGLVERLNPIVHWGHGTAMGVVRGLLDAAGISRTPATLAFFPIVWAGDAALYFALGIAPPPWQWSRQELMTDLFGKGVFAFSTSGAFIALERAR
jgi:hypothetical protein